MKQAPSKLQQRAAFQSSRTAAFINKLEFVHNILRGATLSDPIGLAALEESTVAAK